MPYHAPSCAPDPLPSAHSWRIVPRASDDLVVRRELAPVRKSLRQLVDVPRAGLDAGVNVLALQRSFKVVEAAVIGSSFALSPCALRVELGGNEPCGR